MACNGLLNFSTSKLLLPRNFVGIVQQAGIRIRTLEQRLNIPPRPKRPLNPFMKFSLLERPKLKEQFPSAKTLELSKIIGQKWAQCDQELKTRLQEEYKTDMVTYSREMMRYERDLSDEQKFLMKQESEKSTTSKEKNRLKARLVELGKPKKPPTAFILYMLARLNSKEMKTNYSGWLNDLSKEWIQLPPEKREKYEIESKKLMEQYKHDMIFWEEKMIRQGHIDVVRRQVLLDLKDTKPSS